MPHDDNVNLTNMRNVTCESVQHCHIHYDISTDNNSSLQIVSVEATTVIPRMYNNRKKKTYNVYYRFPAAV